MDYAKHLTEMQSKVKGMIRVTDGVKLYRGIECHMTMVDVVLEIAIAEAKDIEKRQRLHMLQP